MHLVMGEQHDKDRAEAEKLRSFPVVPRLKQPEFPREHEFGWAGHWVDGGFRIQNNEEFVSMNVLYKTQAVYHYIDPRGNRAPRVRIAGIIETNVSFSSGLARELAALVDAGKLEEAQVMTLAAAKAGMEKLEKRTGYRGAYMALHPDAVGTLSIHYGLWPVDPEKRCLIGRSAGGKRGKRGFRMIGDAFMAVLRHHRAIGLPEDLIRQPMKNMRKRHPDDWSVGLAMDKVVRRELGKLPDGEEILKRAAEYQRGAARDWLERFGRAGGYQQREYKKKMARRKDAARKLIETVSSEKERQAEANGVVIADLTEKLARGNAEMAALQEKNEELTEHGQFLESEITALGTVLKQSPGETVGEAAVRVTAQTESGEKAQRENVSLKKDVTKLQEVVASAMSLLKRILKFFSVVKHPQLAERIRKFEQLVGESVMPENGPDMNL